MPQVEIGVMHKTHHRWVFEKRNTKVADKLAANRGNRLQGLMSFYQM